jgi:hypothetical protein
MVAVMSDRLAGIGRPYGSADAPAKERQAWRTRMNAGRRQRLPDDAPDACPPTRQAVGGRHKGLADGRRRTTDGRAAGGVSRQARPSLRAPSQA